MDLLTRTLRHIAPLADADVDLLRGQSRGRDLERGTHLLRAGDPSVWLGVVQDGVLREYFTLPTGLARTKSFATEGFLTGSLPDALADRPAICSIVAESDATVIVVRSAALFAWFETNTATLAWGAALYRRQYLEKADRERELTGMDAWGRYQAFRQRHPGLEARVSQRLVASFVGVTPEHLSRMRARHRSASV